MFIIFTFAFIISIVLIIINSFISKKSYIDREKLSPFECGFDPKNNSRIPFSLRFYLIALIFLIFDVEITLVLPFPILLKSMNLLPLMIMVSYFIFILIFGLFHEWNEGALEWSV